MDFKVAGTRDFITALQLDTKLDGLPSKILAGALDQARDARFYILDIMARAIDSPDEMAPTAPRVLSVRIPVDKIGEVIGPKGKMINQIQEDTGADLTVEDDDTVGSPDKTFLWPITVTETIDNSFGYVMDLIPDTYHEPP